MAYEVLNGKTTREFAAKREALSHAKALVRDGWPTKVRDMLTSEIVYSNDAGAEQARLSNGGKHPGGRPRGVTMPCGWCGAKLTAREMREHFTTCPKRPKPLLNPD